MINNENDQSNESYASNYWVVITSSVRTSAISCCRGLGHTLSQGYSRSASTYLFRGRCCSVQRVPVTFVSVNFVNFSLYERGIVYVYILEFQWVCVSQTSYIDKGQGWVSWPTLFCPFCDVFRRWENSIHDGFYASLDFLQWGFQAKFIALQNDLTSHCCCSWKVICKSNGERLKKRLNICVD